MNLAQLTSSSERRFTSVKRNKSWRNTIMPKKIKFASPPLSFKATNYKSLALFESFVEKATFYFNNHGIKVNKVVMVDSISIKQHSSCSGCVQAKDVNNLVSLLHTVAWQNLKHSDPPQNIPLEMKRLATAMRQLVINNTDNTSAKEFASVLLGLIKCYSFCNGHCTNCKLLTPKCIEEAGGLNLQVEMEGYLHPITSDTSCDSPTPPKQKSSRQQPSVNYKEESTTTVESTSGEVESSESSSSSQREESSTEDDLTSVYKGPSQPATLDTAVLTGIPDVLLMGTTASPIVIVEGKFCKDIPSKDARDSDIGQLLFYMVGNLMKNADVERDEQYVLGILIEGKQFLVCYGTMTLAEEYDMQIDLRVSKFYDLFDASNLAYLSELCFNIANLNN